jgi:cytochrome c553
MHLPTLTRRLLLVCAALGAWPLAAQNMETGKEINGTCAGCHGEFGQGGKRGEYPRIAGQHAKYLEQQLKAFRARQRVNIPMYPYTQERELPDSDIRDVAAYLAAIELPTEIPDFKDTDDALTRLTAMEKVMIVGRVEGDIVAGGAIYQKQCAVCHAKNGKGRGMFPMLVGQYTQYLARQLEAYRKGERPHDEDEVKQGSLMNLSEQDLQNILAYLTSIQKP